MTKTKQFFFFVCLFFFYICLLQDQYNLSCLFKFTVCSGGKLLRKFTQVLFQVCKSQGSTVTVVNGNHLKKLEISFWLWQQLLLKIRISNSKYRPKNKLKLQAAMNGPSQSTRVGACCCWGVLRTWPRCPITAYTSLNCTCFGQCRKGLNAISCVQHVRCDHDCICKVWSRSEWGSCCIGWRCCRRVCSPFSRMSSYSVWYGEKKTL